MKVLRFVAGAVLLALLVFVAYDLHRIANAVAPRGASRTVGDLNDDEFRKFHAEYDAHLKNQQKLIGHDLDVIFGRGDLDQPAKRKNAAQPSR